MLPPDLFTPERRLRAILDGTRAASWEWNLNTGAVRLSSNWFALLGYVREDFSEISIAAWEEMCHQGDLGAARVILQQHLAGEVDHYEYTIRMRHKDGRWRWIHTRGKMLMDHLKQSTGWLMGTHLDVTAEHESRHHLQRLAVSLPGVIYSFVIGRDGSRRFSYVSGRTLEFFGIAAEDILVDANLIFDLISGEDRARFEASIMTSFEKLGLWSQDFRVVQHGDVRWMRGEALPERDDDGGVTWHGMVVDVSAQKAMERELELLSRTDDLTQLFNRRHALVRIEELIRRAERYGAAFSLVSLDLDHFKSVNDGYGHLVGDQVLKAVGEFLRKHVRKTDLAARMGGEEFLLLLPDTGIDGALAMSNAIRRGVERLRFQGNDGTGFGITVSSGVTEWCPDRSSVTALLQACDISLYRAKAAGRNRSEAG